MYVSVLIHERKVQVGLRVEWVFIVMSYEKVIGFVCILIWTCINITILSRM